MTAWDDYVRSEDGQREYAVTDAEQKVQAAWKIVIANIMPDEIWVWSGPEINYFQSWQAALEFTEARQREIAELREDLEFMEHCDGPGAGRERIIERLRAILAEKRLGIKEEALSVQLVNALASRNEDPPGEYVLYENYLRALEEERQARFEKVSEGLALQRRDGGDAS